MYTESGTKFKRGEEVNFKIVDQEGLDEFLQKPILFQNQKKTKE